MIPPPKPPLTSMPDRPHEQAAWPSRRRGRDVPASRSASSHATLSRACKATAER